MKNEIKIVGTYKINDGRDTVNELLIDGESYFLLETGAEDIIFTELEILKSFVDLWDQGRCLDNRSDEYDTELSDLTDKMVDIEETDVVTFSDEITDKIELLLSNK